MGISKPKVPFTCQQCGGVFEVYPSHAKRGTVRFCSIGCGTTYRNLRDNPARRPEVREKIAASHADVAGTANPMYGRRGRSAPGWVDGRNSIVGNPWRKIAFTHLPKRCADCGANPENSRRLHVHHRDKDRSNNALSNLEVLCVTCHNLNRHPRQRDPAGRFRAQ